MTAFATEMASNYELWTPDMAETSELQDILASLQERGVVAARGVTPQLAETLGSVARQAHIVEFCEGEPERFGDSDKVAAWQQKGREMWTFHEIAGAEGKPIDPRDIEIDEADLILLQYGWAGSKQNPHIPGADITTAYRSTEQGQNRKLATPLIKFVVGATIQLHELGPESISLETWESNRRAIPLYERSGFRLIRKGGWENRGTQLPVGEHANGMPVRVDARNENRRIVTDRRWFMQYDPADRLAA